MFATRFADVEQKKLVTILDLPARSDEIFTASLPDINSTSLVYGSIAPTANFPLSRESNDSIWDRPAPVGQTISGRAEIIDTLTLSVGSQKVRLAGLELPAEGSSCTLLSGSKGDCRTAAADQLGFFLRWRAVTCNVSHQSDDEGMPLADCRVGESDIGEWLVRRGWVLPQAAATQNYRAALLFAQSYKLGQWRP